MLWIKALHIVFVVMWFAGLMYLPRLYIYHQQATEPAMREVFKTMEARLLVITHIGAVLALGFGALLLSVIPSYLQQPWLHAKLGLVLLLVVYHGYLVKLKNDFRVDRCRHSSTWLRLFNEVPALLLIGVVILVVVKPVFSR